ncbi:hypothetical protein LVB87_08460 [Lysobacter sp. KIS68-7]|uniref:hypothetical protein n=1 Tax=Lysobacter sp. KIS68-7 TaxID=2904252 RepID=UPI001E634B3E|nr:hypothetical protein [Lysobacter sp. KIS68-7]UHQ18261.1 hypothetical protein LVB87_08460 [Lysobacter sp. KIS68-7]
MDPGLTPLEVRVLRRCIAKAPAEVAEELRAQLAEATLTRTPDRAFGYYVDFEVSSYKRDQGEEPFVLECSGGHPDGQNIMFFMLYVVGGVLDFLELSSTGDWPDDESGIELHDDV